MWAWKLSDIRFVCVYMTLAAHLLRVETQQYSYSAGVFSSPLVLNCTSGGQSGTLMWYSYINGSTNSQIVVFCTLPSVCQNYTSLYTSSVSPPLYSLGIPQLNAQTSTKYTCTVLSSTETDILYYTISLEKLSCPPSGTAVQEGTDVLMTCTSVYYQYTKDPEHVVFPGLSWMSGLGTNFEGNSTATNNRTLYSANVTMTAEYDEVPFTCSLTFPSSTGLTYTDSCQVSYQIAHGVTTVNPGLDSTGGVPTLNVGDVLNCTANGKPQPTIKWVDQSGLLLSSTSVLTVSDQLAAYSQPVNCSCVASNVINGVDYDASSNVTFYVQNNAVVQSSGVDGWVIALAVCIPLLVIIAASIAGFLFYRHRKAKQSANTNGTTAYTAVSTDPDSAVAQPNSITTSAPNPAPMNGAPPQRSGNSTPAGGQGALGVEYINGSASVLNLSASSYVAPAGPAYVYNPQQRTAPISLNPYPNSRPTPVPPMGNPRYPYTGPIYSRPASGDIVLSNQSGHPDTSNQMSPSFVPSVRRQRSSQAGSVTASEV